jgi:hypothetical protein
VSPIDENWKFARTGKTDLTGSEFRCVGMAGITLVLETVVWSMAPVGDAFPFIIEV